MKELTDRQREILNFLNQYNLENNYWPSIRDIQLHFGFRSTNAVVGHLRALERKEIIVRVPGQARAYQLNYEGDGTRPHNLAHFSDVVDIPVYGSIAAGYPDGVEPGNAVGRLQIDIDTAGIGRNRRAFALKVRGESMIDAGIFDGDIVIVEPGEPRNGDIVAALIDNETTLKRYIQQSRRSPFLKAENSRYPALYPVAELIIQGIAKAVVRSL